MPTEQLLRWSGMTDTEHTASGSKEDLRKITPKGNTATFVDVKAVDELFATL